MRTLEYSQHHIFRLRIFKMGSIQLVGRNVDKIFSVSWVMTFAIKKISELLKISSSKLISQIDVSGTIFYSLS